MNTVFARLVSTGLLLLLILLSGFWLSRSGKPYPVLIFTVHKLLALAAVIVVARLVYQVSHLAPLQAVQIAALAAAGVCLAVLFVSGGLLSAATATPPIALRLHQLIPYLAVAALGASLYLLLLPGGRLDAL